MPNDKTPPWSAARETPAPPPPALRALNPQTSAPIPALTLRQRLILSTLDGAGHAFVAKWLPRQLLKILSIAAAAIGAADADTTGTVAWLVCGATFLLELLLSFLSRRFLQLKSA